MVLHVDMDAFYASVEQRDDPSLTGKPVIVGGQAKGRGVVCAASYEAREYGVHSAMPASKAHRLCPHGIFLSPRMNHYANVSRQIRDIFERYTPIVEPLSLDEAFLDVAGSQRLFGSETDIGQRIKRDIRAELNLVASVGVAPNKFLAKVASDLEKPDGFVVVTPADIRSFLDPLPISRLWGVGKVTRTAFDRWGIRTVAQVRKQSLDVLQTNFGDFGEHVWKLAHGIDDRLVVSDRIAKSLSHETTWDSDITDTEAIRAWILELADQVGRRMRRIDKIGKTVQLKVRFSDFRTLVRSQSLTNATNVTQEIFDAAATLYDDRIPQDDAVRLVGVGMSQITEAAKPRQKMLFEEEEHQQHRRADLATDEIRNRFGSNAVARGSRLLHNTKHRPGPTKDS